MCKYRTYWSYWTTGPSGTNTLSAYGGKYNNNSQTINLGILTQSVIPLPTSMPNLNVTYSPQNSITISQSGVYEINYYSNISVALATTITLAIRIGGTNIPSTIISRALSVGTNSIFSGSTIVNLNAGDVIDMAISALLSVGVTLGNGVNATLTVKRIG